MQLLSPRMRRITNSHSMRHSQHKRRRLNDADPLNDSIHNNYSINSNNAIECLQIMPLSSIDIHHDDASNTLPPLHQIVDLTEELSENDDLSENQTEEEDEDTDYDDDEIQIIEDNNHNNNSNSHAYDAIALDLTQSVSASPPASIPALYHNLNVNAVDSDEHKDEIESDEDNDVIVTKITKPSIVPLIENHKMYRKKLRLQKIEQWIKDEDDDFLSQNVRKLLLLCPICQESLIERNPTSTPCGHIFCADCLLSALNRVSKCPMCQASMNVLQSHKVYL